MGYFSARDKFLFLALGGLVLLLIWHFSTSTNPVADLAPNLITDIMFGIFLLAYLEQLSKRERETSGRARRRASALSVQRFYQAVTDVVGCLVADGIQSRTIKTIPSASDIESRANELFGTTSRRGRIDPLPYAAFAVSFFTGATEANVYPRRTAREFVGTRAGELEELYLACISIDDGWMTDEVIDALTILKDHSLMAMCRTMRITEVRVGYWPERDIEDIAAQLSALSKFFCSVLGLTHSPYETHAGIQLVNGYRKIGISVDHATAGESFWGYTFS